MTNVELYLEKPIHVLGIPAGQTIQLDYYWEDEDSMRDLFNDIYNDRIRILIEDEVITLDPFEILIENLIGDLEVIEIEDDRISTENVIVEKF